VVSVTPSIDSALATIAPGFRALSIMVEAAPVAHPDVATQLLAQACKAVRADDFAWAEDHLEAWNAGAAPAD
jgi:DNA/RNA-binding domain of Phe-tRNA-synthetase-like protein